MIFLIDSENLGDSVYNDISKLKESDEILIFYSTQTGKLSIGSHINLSSSICKKEYILVTTGTKNALDFQLSSYLGFLIASNDNIMNHEEYVIISKDKGYDAVCKFWKTNNIKIMRCLNLNLDTEQTATNNIKSALLKVEIKDPQDITKISGIIDKTKTKQGINNALVKEFKNEKAGIIYKAIKPYLSQK